jgi:hypothetical protein
MKPLKSQGLQFLSRLLVELTWNNPQRMKYQDLALLFLGGRYETIFISGVRDDDYCHIGM